MHIYPSESGHLHDVDCWCEPIGYWLVSDTGESIFVVDHDDNHDTPDAEGLIFPRDEILLMRSQEPDWVTTLLNRLIIRLLPPHE